MNDGLKIGELARRAGVTAKAIRFYERKRVLPLATRAANGYRLYDDDAVEMLAFVKQATGLGLTLAEIIAIRQGGRPPCTHVQRLLREKARELDRKLADLLEMRRQVRRSLAAWKRAPRGLAAVCPHIESGAPQRRPAKRGRVAMATEKRQVKIGGMACSFCVETIKKGLGRTEGVSEVNVSLAHEEALINYDPARVTPTRLTGLTFP